MKLRMERTRAWYSKWVDISLSFEGERGSVVKEVLRHHPLSKRMKKILQDKKQIVFLYLDIVQFAEIERRFGERTAGELLQIVESSIRKVAVEMFSEEELLEVENFWGDDFLVCFQREEAVDENWLYDVTSSLRVQVVQEINISRPKLLSSPLDLHIGYAVLKNSGEALDRQLYQTIKSAVKMARKTAKGGTDIMMEFRNLLSKRQVEAYFQPIISMETGEPLGWEALSRGPKGSRFERPDSLFAYAEESGELYQLERICRERAIEKSEALPHKIKLFLNINPRTIDDPNFTKGETRRLLDRYGLTPSQIVFEITERHSIQDYTAFRKTLEHYRQQGYLIAVDDAGAGYSSLQSIVELCPDFIKMDMSLVRGVHNDPVKQALLEAFVTLARKIKCKIIAEGIEYEEELKTLHDLGIDYAQGYLLGRPLPLMTTSIPTGVQTFIERKRLEKVSMTSATTLQIGTIATSTFVIPPETTVKEVHELFENRRQISSVVVAEQLVPLGLLTRDQLYTTLGSQYGVPLYYRKSVRDLMDRHPLMVDQQLLIDEVSALATGRNNLKRYDDVIVTQGGEFRGVVSVQTLLDVMSKIKIEIAKYANPLTGLPGNTRIEEELRLWVRGNEPFCVLYIDLDKFKQFNDTCGFEHGDQMIMFISQLLHRQLNKYGAKQDFLGHIGGDDFVVITTPERCDVLGHEILRLFNRAVRMRLRQLGQQGVELSVSLAAIEIPSNSEMDPLEIAAHAAEMKGVAKREIGCTYVKRRIEHGVMCVG